MKPPALPAEIANALENLATMNPEVRARAVELNRREVIPYLEAVKVAAEVLCERLPDLHPMGFQSGTLATRIDQLWNVIEHLGRVDARDRPNQIDDALRNVAQHSVYFLEAAATWQQVDAARLQAEISAIRSAVTSLREEATANIQTAIANGERTLAESLAKASLQFQSTQESANAALATVQEAAKRALVSVESTRFGTEAEAHEKKATRWFWLSLAITVMVVVVLLVLAGSPWPLNPNDPRTNFDVARFFTVRALCAVAGYYLLNLAVRNYRAHQHNEVINRHREKALQTFEGFHNSTSSKAVQDAVLLQASTAVFSAHSTGFLGGDEVVTQGAIIDAIKLATGAPASPPAQPPATPP